VRGLDGRGIGLRRSQFLPTTVTFSSFLGEIIMSTLDTITPEQRADQASPRRPMRRSVKIVGVIVGVLVVLIVAMFMRMNYVPAELDYATTRLSEQGLFEVSYTPNLAAVSINQIQSWTLHVESADGALVENATITVDGDMPQHNHGLPTQPQVTAYLGNGDYQVEGLKFHMPGWWVVDFVITADGQSDQVRFNMLLN
jgi:hypothetical protein